MDNKKIEDRERFIYGFYIIFYSVIFIVASKVCGAVPPEDVSGNHFHLPSFLIVTAVIGVASFLFGWLVNQLRNDRLFMKNTSCERIRADCKEAQLLRAQATKEAMNGIQSLLDETRSEVKATRICNQRTHEAVIALASQLSITLPN